MPTCIAICMERSQQCPDSNAGVGQRGDCGSPKGGITACPGAGLACSGHGFCSEPRFQMHVFCRIHERGLCDAYMPRGSVVVRCTHYVRHGPCWRNVATWNFDRTKGECKCRNNFEGGACERMSCPEVTQHALDMENAYRWLNLQFNPPNIPMVQRAHLRMVEPDDPYHWDYNKFTAVSVIQDITAMIAHKRRAQKGTIQ